MKKLLVVICAVIAMFAFSVDVFAKGTGKGGSNVRGYTTKKGKHVEPHKRSAPDKTKHDNRSTKGNVNPHTGKRGTKK